MEKIPVGGSIGGAYGFLFGRILTIISLSWLPALIYAVGRIAFVHYELPGMVAAMQSGQHPSFAAHLALLVFFLFALLMIAAIALPLNREALGHHNEPAIAHLVIGPRALRLFAANLRYVVLIVAVTALLVMAAMGIVIGTKMALANWGAALAQWPVLRIVHVATAVAMLLLVLFVALRLMFLIGPVAAIEDKARLARSWSLSAGNFWRMLAIFLAIVVPVLVVMGGAEIAILGTIPHPAPRTDGHPDVGVVFNVIFVHAPALIAVSVAGLVALLALFAGAGAVAYQTLVPPPESGAGEPSPAPSSPETHARIEPVVTHEPEPAPQAEAEHQAEPVHEEHVEEPAHSEEPPPEMHAAPEEEHHGDAQHHAAADEHVEAHEMVLTEPQPEIEAAHAVEEPPHDHASEAPPVSEPPVEHHAAEH